MRSTLYWLTSTAVAVLCMKAAATPNVDEGAMIVTFGPELVDTVTDPVRSMLLGVGIMAVAYTYRRVWLNFAPARKQ